MFTPADGTVRDNQTNVLSAIFYIERIERSLGMKWWKVVDVSAIRCGYSGIK